MAFETFTGSGRSFSREPRITILKQGNFSINVASMQTLKEHKAKFVQLLYDRDTHRIALKPCPKNAEGAYAIREKNNIGQVSGTAFLKCYKIPFGDQTRSHPTTWDDDAGMLIIKLQAL